MIKDMLKKIIHKILDIILFVFNYIFLIIGVIFVIFSIIGLNIGADKYNCLFVMVYGFFFISAYYAEEMAKIKSNKVKLEFDEDLCNLTEHLIRVVKSINRSAAVQNKLNQQLYKEVKKMKREIKELKEEIEILKGEINE